MSGRIRIALIVAMAAVCFIPLPAAQNNLPNIVIIIADDMGYSDAGCYGGEIQTPNLDKLASGGVRFTSFYNTGRCWPTRSALMTGYYPQQIRTDPRRGLLPKWTRTLPHYLGPLGYRSYHSGKWHVPGAPLPVKDGGFDRSYILQDHNRFFYPQKAALDDKPLPPVKPGTGFYTTTAITDYALDFLRGHESGHKGEPFFLYVAYNAPHFPLHAPAEDIEKYKDRYLDGWDNLRDRRYERLREAGLINTTLSEREPTTKPSWNFPEEKLKDMIGPGEAGHAVAWTALTREQKRLQATKMAIHAAMVDRVDQEAGRVLRQVRDMGVYDNTIFMFLSDNGASAEQIIRGDMHDKTAPAGSGPTYLCLGPGFSTAANTPFRRHKSWVHEGGISTPFIVKWAKGISARGDLRHTPGHVIDIVPTILDITGAKPAPEWNGVAVPPLPGRSLASAFRKDVTIDRPYLFFSHIGNQAIRIGNWKLVSAKHEGDTWELYDLTRDRAESNNLAEKYPGRVKAMGDKWTALDKEFYELAGEGLEE